MKKLLSLLLIGVLLFSVPLPSAYAGIVSATGGTITTVGSDKVHTFTTSGTFTPTGSGDVLVLVIAGGGGGGNWDGGGGGAGGLVYHASKAVTSGTGVTVTVGGGGAGGSQYVKSYPGSDSYFGDIHAHGGGAGGSCEVDPTSLAGGSGGANDSTGVQTSTATQDNSGGGTGYGNVGGAGASSGGGGGGAGGAGSAASGATPGVGGVGKHYSISGSDTGYAGGGGGGNEAGGAGGSAQDGGGAGGVPGVAGTANTGGGGGGGSNRQVGGIGGSGIVIVRYTPSAPEAPTNVAATDGTATNKVTITWTKSTGATGYKIYEGANLLDTLGDVATYDDSAAPAPTITPGTTTASDGVYSAHVTLSLAGTSANNGTSRTYKLKAIGAGGDSADSSTDTGYRGVGALTYQWQMSAADSDASYSNLNGATASTYNATEAPIDGSGRYFKCVLDATGATQQASTVDRGYRMAGGYQLIMVE
jgi:hypothetical protein